MLALAALAPLTALPWLQGFFAPAGVSDVETAPIVAELAPWRAPDTDCSASAYGGLAVAADVAPVEGEERVLASYTQGVVVFDREHHVIAHAPGFACEGSADELVALAVGDGAIGAPLVALAATSGGKTENVTTLSLYRIGTGGALTPVFTGEVEVHVDQTTRTGVVTLVPGGLVYREPSGLVSLWTFDDGQGRYVEQLVTRPSA
jgi:hypothetical protein